MKKSNLFNGVRWTLLVCLIWLATPAHATHYAVVGEDDDVQSLHIIDPSDGTLIDEFPITLPEGFLAEAFLALTIDPQTGKFLTILENDEPPPADSYEDGRYLASIDRASGAMEIIGLLAQDEDDDEFQYFTTLEFTCDGRLLTAQANSNSLDVEGLMMVDPSTAELTELGKFPYGDDTYGRSFAENPMDGHLYGIQTLRTDSDRFHSLVKYNLDTGNFKTIPLPIFPDTYVYFTDMTWSWDERAFLVWIPSIGEGSEGLYKITPTGEVTYLGSDPEKPYYKAMVDTANVGCKTPSIPAMNSSWAPWLTASLLMLLGFGALRRIA